jgi:hypothetical protein
MAFDAGFASLLVNDFPHFLSHAPLLLMESIDSKEW